MTTVVSRYRVLFALVGLFGVLAAGFSFLHYRSTLNPSTSSLEKVDSAVDFQKEKDYWHTRIVSVGGEGAYREMIQKGKGVTASRSHVLAHSFGEALFQAEGVEGLAVCGPHFVYGCYHQFIGNAIAALGLPVVEKFRAACASKSLLGVFPCLHGLGHGILGYLGYSLEDLKKALTLCKASNFGEEGSGCIDGVFMEYNIHELTAYTSGKIVPRTFSPDRAYSPCFEVNDRYRTQCVYELPNWWVASMPDPADIEGRFAQAGMYCARMEDEVLVRTCFTGLGHIVPPLSDLNPDVALALCAAAASSFDTKESCLLAAVGRFKIEGFKEYESLCSIFGFSGGTLAKCLKSVRESVSDISARRNSV